MKPSIDIESWNRKEQFFSFQTLKSRSLDLQPMWTAQQQINAKKDPFLLYYLHRALKVANEVENFRYRIIDNIGKEPIEWLFSVGNSCHVSRHYNKSANQ